ncbi:hypothetical protein [Andreprevotia lacus]|nr:hypothetical protein [Andreprevotia lacus]
MSYQLVYDIADSGNPATGALLLGLAGAVVLLVPLLARRQPGGWLGTRLSLAIWLGLGGLLMLAAFSTYQADDANHRMLTESSHNLNARVASGPVRDFRYERSRESFCVDGQCFSYSEADPADGFHATAEMGGPIKPGLPVRVTYVGEVIVRLEVAQ